MTDILRADDEAVERAARRLRYGGVVAFPTETVYGLGALADDPTSVARVFEVKGRPPDNPLIVHVAELAQIARVATEFDERARELAARFWPGPLTLVLPRHRGLPDAVSAGLPTVAVRMPDHPVALALIRLTGPLAAPSANRSGRPSPTRAEHVVEDLGDRVDLVLDGGPCRWGLESTVLDLTGPVPLVLRPGGITVEQLCEVLGQVELHPTVDAPTEHADARAPGMRHRHYSPDAELLLVEPASDAVEDRQRAGARARELAAEWTGSVVLGVGIAETGPETPTSTPTTIRSFGSVEEAARELFGVLRGLDASGIERIVVVGVPARGLGRSLMNRLRKAATRVESVGDGPDSA